MKANKLQKIRIRRTNRSRARLFGTADKPRLSVFRSNRFMYAQLIDDDKGNTLVSVNSQSLKEKINKTQLAEKVGEMLAEKAKAKSIAKAVFDRGNYKYHGRVKAVADGARKGGLKF